MNVLIRYFNLHRLGFIRIGSIIIQINLHLKIISFLILAYNFYLI